jgi:uncharacterized Fe-S cluster-containing radical SAM superfamily protein
MGKLNFLCSRVNKEIVILADGRITTCCLDPQGQNVFADIHKDDYNQTIKKLQIFKQRLAEDPNNFPRCLQCFMIRKRTDHATANAFLMEDPSQTDLDKYLTRQEVLDGLVIEVTSACNLTCIGCPTGIQNQKNKMTDNKNDSNLFMDLEATKKWLGPIIDKTRNIRLFNYGEPLLHTGTVDFCSFITQSNSKINLTLATNLLPLNQSRIQALVKSQPTTIIVSLHGASQESVAKYMGSRSNMNFVLTKMKTIISERNRLGLRFPIIIWKYILFKWNDSDEELEKAKKLAKVHQIDYLGFEFTHGELASKKFSSNSKALYKLKGSKYYIVKKFMKIARMNHSRKYHPWLVKLLRWGNFFCLITIGFKIHVININNFIP